MQSSELSGIIVARLMPGEDFYSSLKELCEKHNVKSAAVLSGIGQLKEFELGYFKEKGNYLPEKFSKAHELISLSGLINKNEKGEYEFHLHAVLSNEKKNAVGGHLIAGKVSITNELLIQKISLPLKRNFDENTGLMNLSP